MESDMIEPLIELQASDRKRDRLQKKLDDIPIKLKSHTDRISKIESELAVLVVEYKVDRTEADREELEVKALEAEREKLKKQMNAPGLNNREYLALQEHLTGVLADINSHSDVALKAMTKAEEIDEAMTGLKEQLSKAQDEYGAAREQLEGSLQPTKDDLEKRNGDRVEYLPGVNIDALAVYERVRTKHKDAMAVLDGTIDRAAGRIGSDLHCSACYMTVTANDAVRILARKEIVQCKSCVRVLYVP